MFRASFVKGRMAGRGRILRMVPTSVLLTGIEVEGPSFRCAATKLPTPLAVLIGANGCGKSTMLQSVLAAGTIAKLCQRRQGVPPSQKQLSSAFKLLRALGAHVDRVRITYADGASFSLQGNWNQSPKSTSTATAKLTNIQGKVLWKESFTQSNKGDPNLDDREQARHRQEAAIMAEARGAYFSTDVELVDTHRLTFRVPPSETLVRKYDGVVLAKSEGASTNKLRNFFNMISADPPRPPSIPRVHVLSKQIGIAADEIASAYKAALAERDSRSIAKLLRDRSETSDLETIAAKVYAEEERLQESLRRIGMGDMPRFAEISLSRALAERPAIAREYLSESLVLMGKLQRKIEPLYNFFREAERILGGCSLHIRKQDEVLGPNVFFPPEQQRVMVVRYSDTSGDCELESLSSGQQQMIVLLARIWLGRHPHGLLESTSPRLLLIDEPEISMHLTWQHEIAQQLSRVAAQGGTQVIAATHSNFVSGSLPPGCIVEL
jgi:energy-coupling factor transporter ATP-binding protein EcfA2